MASPDFRRWVSTRRSSVSGPGGKRIETYNHNKLLAGYEGALGIKNGYTSRAKASFVGAATRNGRTLVVSTMRTQPRVHVEAAALLDWGFAALTAGAQPVGTLVDPVGEAAAAALPAAATGLPARARHRRWSTPWSSGRWPTPSGADDPGSGLPLPALTLAALGAATLVLRRRRQVVLARSAARRRSAAAARPGAVRADAVGTSARPGPRPPRPTGTRPSTGVTRGDAVPGVPRPTAARSAAPRSPSPAPAARRSVPRR